MPKGQRGGAQPGAGRPKGLKNTKTQELVASFLKDGITPMEALLEGMRYYFKLVQEKSPEIQGYEFAPENEEKFRQLIGLRTIVKDYAVAAAPYIHPKLASLQANVKVQNIEAELAELE